MNRKGESFYDIYIRNEALKGRSVKNTSVASFMKNHQTPEDTKHGLKGTTTGSTSKNDGSGFHQGNVNGVYCSSGYGTPH